MSPTVHGDGINTSSNGRGNDNMTVCDKGHEEIVYEGRTCPFCVAMKEWEIERDDLKEALDVAQAG